VSGAVQRGQNDLVRERFTRSAEAFARLATPHRSGDAELIARLADTKPEAVALDLACGPGTFTMALARRSRHVFGLDLTPALLDRARRRASDEGAGNVTLFCCDATALPLPDASVDAAICGYSFHHMSEPLSALRELARVVRRGGRLALVDIIVSRDADSEAADEIERARDASHRHTFRRAEFPETVERAGFRVRAIEQLDRARLFSEWMRIAGWAPADPAWRNTRRLMEAGLPDEAPGFRAQLLPADGEAEPEIEFVQSCMFLAASKP
jgi:ubiquinone/menaquinone biosynthesis C-methylase UbiE